jgi:membrane peptidoglycan carboxypeptidase
MLRQPGSSIKGFLYALALDEEILTEDSSVIDEPISVGGYKPNNWYHGYRGEVTLKKAVALSINTIAVKTLQNIGPDKFKNKMSKAADISFGRFDANLSLALGSGELTPMELARLYGILLNSGNKVYPRLIEKIISPDGAVLYEFPIKKSDEKIISSKAAKDTIQLLKAVIEDEEGTASWIGKRKENLNINFPVAAKTGTVQTDKSVMEKFSGMKGVHDVWFVALVPGEVDVVWLGHDRGAPFEGSGTGTAGGVWMYYAEQALKSKIKTKFSLFNDSKSPFEHFWDRFKNRKKKNQEDADIKNNENPPGKIDDSKIIIPEHSDDSEQNKIVR